jgi:nitrogen fixation-related uncharacterized protein
MMVVMIMMVVMMVRVMAWGGHSGLFSDALLASARPLIQKNVML